MSNKRNILISCAENQNACLKQVLEEQLFSVTISNLSLLKDFKKLQPAIIITDIDIPDIKTNLKEIKRISNTPVIIYTQNNDIVNKLLSFELGCDDYILYSCDIKEVIARVNAVLNRCKADKNLEEVVVFEGLLVNKTAYQVSVMGETIFFPPKELELLYTLACSPNKVFTRDELLDRVWGYEYYGDTRTVDVHIDRIRKKLKNCSFNWSIKTVYGIGYKFEIS